MTSSSSAVSNKSRMGTYDNWSCDLLCAADLYRINLEQGRFLSPLRTQSPSLNVVSRRNLHGPVVCGGAVECFDMRMKSSAARITHGGDDASVFIYDLRTFSAPIHVKDHMYESPILSTKWQRTPNTQQPMLIATDKQIVRICDDPNTGDGMNSIQPSGGGGINDMICVFSGGIDSSVIPSYFIPELGPAPKWCSLLENLKEEMEETTIYDRYKFVTKEDLEKLQLTPLFGTALLKAQMHGYFMNHNLYKKVYVYPTGRNTNKRAKLTVVESGSGSVQEEPGRHYSLQKEIGHTRPSSPTTTLLM